MKLEVNINKKVGVINITSNSFVLEDLKAHICKKMKIKENDFKMKISLEDVAKIELIEIVNKTNKTSNNKAPSLNLDSSKSRKKVSTYLENEIKKIYSMVKLVYIRESSFDNTRPKISVHFKDTMQGEAITFFGTERTHFNKPISDKLLNRTDEVFNIIEPFLSDGK